MTSRTILLSLHIAAVASWLGADIVQHAMHHRWKNESLEVNLGWVRMQHFLHDRYYAIVAVLILLTGVGLVFDGDWSWGSNFIWVGFATIVIGGVGGGVFLKGLSTQKLAALEAGDAAAAEAATKRALPIELFLTASVLVSIVAMVHRWGGSI